MTPVSPEEISALFDGELTPDRAEEVRRAVVEDEGIATNLRADGQMDRDLSSFAAACQFEPHVSLPSSLPVLGLPIYLIALGLLVVRILAKVLPIGPGIWLQTLVIALVAVWLLYQFFPALRTDTWQAVHEMAQFPVVAVTTVGELGESPTPKTPRLPGGQPVSGGVGFEPHGVPLPAAPDDARGGRPADDPAAGFPGRRCRRGR